MFIINKSITCTHVDMHVYNCRKGRAYETLEIFGKSTFTCNLFDISSHKNIGVTQ